MTADLVIRNGRVVTPTGVIHGGVAIEGETIIVVDADAQLPAARRTLDARGQYVLPGLIDAHVHMASEEDASTRGPRRWAVSRDRHPEMYTPVVDVPAGTLHPPAAVELTGSRAS